MSGDLYFELSEDYRTRFIDSRIVEKLPRDSRQSAKERATSIVDIYVGRDSDALSILSYAAERGRFDEFAGKLEQQLRENLGFVDPEIRRFAEIPDVGKAQVFFLQCYEELGIQSRN